MNRKAIGDRAAAAVGGWVARRSDEQLSGFDRGVRRRILLKVVFAGMASRFQPLAATGVDAVVEWRVQRGGAGEPDRFQVVLRNGASVVVPAGGERPLATLALGAVDLLRLATGSVKWHQLLAAGRLRITGDPLFALRLPELFLGAGTLPR